MSLRDFALLAFVCVVWAANNIVSKFVVTHLGVPPPGVAGCPVGERIPMAVSAAIRAADQAAAARLAGITVADLLGADPGDLQPAPDPAFPTT